MNFEINFIWNFANFSVCAKFSLDFQFRDRFVIVFSPKLLFMNSFFLNNFLYQTTQT